MQAEWLLWTLPGSMIVLYMGAIAYSIFRRNDAFDVDLKDLEEE